MSTELWGTVSLAWDFLLEAPYSPDYVQLVQLSPKSLAIGMLASSLAMLFDCLPIDNTFDITWWKEDSKESADIEIVEKEIVKVMEWVHKHTDKHMR